MPSQDAELLRFYGALRKSIERGALGKTLLSAPQVTTAQQLYLPAIMQAVQGGALQDFPFDRLQRLSDGKNYFMCGFSACGSADIVSPPASAVWDVNLAQDMGAFWRLGEASGVRADASFHGNALTDNNSVASAEGKVGNAASFVNASSQYLSVASNSLLQMGGNAKFTLFCWVKFDVLAVGHPGILGKWGSTGAFEYLLYYDRTSNKFTFEISSNGTAETVVAATSPSPALTNTWYFLRAWYDGSNINLSVDNGTTYSTAFSAGCFAGSAAAQVGAYNATNFIDGRIDAAGILRRVMTASEVTTAWNGGNGWEL